MCFAVKRRSKSGRACASSWRPRISGRPRNACGGPFLKLGQMLSSHSELLSEQVVEVLKPLRQTVEPMGFDTVQLVVEEELGAPLLHSFADFDKQAAAAASLGQVHRATLPSGAEVAVKVQYPGATQSVRGDLRAADQLAWVAKRFLAKGAEQTGRFNVAPMLEELVTHVMQETDYCREAYNAKLLGRLFASDPKVVVPAVHDSHSSLRMISYDWQTGAPLQEALRGPHAQLVATNLMHAFWRQLLEGGVLHADPHPGNFLVQPNGALVLLDFGCVKVFSDSFLRGFRQLVDARMQGDADAMRQAFVELRLIDADSDADDIEGVRRISDFCAVGLDHDHLFDFGAFNYGKQVRELVGFFSSRRRLPPAQADFLLLSRVVLAYHDYLAAAGIQLNLHQLVRERLARLETGRSIPVPGYDG